MRVAGPIAKDLSDPFTGSIFLIAANNEAEARVVLDGDPYIRCDMYADVQIYPFVPAAGHWLGGVIWAERG